MSSEKVNMFYSSSTLVNIFRMKMLFIITDSLGTRCLKNKFCVIFHKVRNHIPSAFRPSQTVWAHI